MRAILITTALAACGTATQGPAAPRDEPTVRVEPVAASPIDAGVDAGPSDIEQRKAALDKAIAKYEEDEAAAMEVIYDAIAAPPKAPSGPPTAEEVAQLDADYERQPAVENGVVVVTIDSKVWCGRSGSRLCASTLAACQRIAPKCSVAVNVACFTATSKTTGAERTPCLATYGRCEQMRAVAVISREYEVTDDCIVMRYRKPTKK